MYVVCRSDGTQTGVQDQQYWPLWLFTVELFLVTLPPSFLS